MSDPAVERLREKNLSELANEINNVEGYAWRLEHDSADGRIEGSVDIGIAALREYVRKVADIFAEKAGTVCFRKYSALWSF